MKDVKISAGRADLPIAKGPISKLERALVNLNIPITERDKVRILDVVSTTPYVEKRIIKFLNDYSHLSLGDALDCLEMVSEYGTRLYVIGSLKKWVFAGANIRLYGD
jgi:hypothetical protein